MELLTAGLPSKSEKIRRLAAAGYRRQEIADFLRIRYQHVRNVLVEAERKKAEESRGLPEAERGWRGEAGHAKARVLADGSVVIPPQIAAEGGFRSGDPVVVHRERDGELHLLSRPEALRRAQAMIRQLVPEGVSLVDELIQERRREAERE